MKKFKEIAFKTKIEDVVPELFLSYRSDGVNVNSGTLCSDELVNTSIPFYIYTNTKPVITTGDLAFTTNNLTAPFDGLGKYYNIAYADFVDGDSYIVQITAGVITVINSCLI